MTKNITTNSHKHLLQIVLLVITLLPSLHAQILTNDPAVSGYFSTPTGQQDTAQIYAQVLLNDTTQITNAGSELALFDGTNCAGYTTIVSGPAPGGREFFLTAWANVSPGPTMSYQFWNSATGLLYMTNIATTFTFTSGTITGTIANPVTLNAVASVPEPSVTALLIISVFVGLIFLTRRLAGRAH
jgi:hypothetical protein